MLVVYLVCQCEASESGPHTHYSKFTGRAERVRVEGNLERRVRGRTHYERMSVEFNQCFNRDGEVERGRRVKYLRSTGIRPAAQAARGTALCGVPSVGFQ